MLQASESSRLRASLQRLRRLSRDLQSQRLGRRSSTLPEHAFHPGFPAESSFRKNGRNDKPLQQPRKTGRFQESAADRAFFAGQTRFKPLTCNKG